ncbi:hypothetical protein CROQUDRAFT_689667 [Cronartium quercuum f. sp. fusiforme G11]|uniref:Uncharacterized protein n=1 Tax=Cronartium quercuum f. sp. fusiforme G11 TaxID=708437 RepID=A0A9P6NAJ0_9BASI|nr:hypothetical protein CROQUDRAFT_689667 [Cronartium quercuum f. sp. fusiforme G11]
MEWWGPLLGVAKFLGEHLCGFLQKINTNGKNYHMAQTIMKQFSHLQRLLSKSPPKLDTNVNYTQRNTGSLFEVENLTYDGLLCYYQMLDLTWTDYRVHLRPDDAHILQPFTCEIGSLYGQEGSFFSKKSPNNIIKINING